MTAIATRTPQSTSTWVPRRSFDAPSWEPHVPRGRWLRPEWPHRGDLCGHAAHVPARRPRLRLDPARRWCSVRSSLLRREPIVIPRSAHPAAAPRASGSRSRCCNSRSGRSRSRSFRWLVFASPLVCLHLAGEPDPRSGSRAHGSFGCSRSSGSCSSRSATWRSRSRTVSMPSPIQRVLPGGLFSNELPPRSRRRSKFAQVQDARARHRSVVPPRRWRTRTAGVRRVGLAHAVLRPRLLHPRQRRGGAGTESLVAVIGLVPIILSLNRGLWLSVGVAFAYVALRRALQGSVKVVLAMAGWSSCSSSSRSRPRPWATSVQQRFEIASESNTARSELYQVAFEREERPTHRLGCAPIEVPGLWREVGTHGLVWFVDGLRTGSRGSPAARCGWSAMLISSTRAPNPIALWAHVAIVVFVIQSADLRVAAAAHARRYRGRGCGSAPSTRRASRNRSHGIGDGPHERRARTSSVRPRSRRVRDSAKGRCGQWASRLGVSGGRSGSARSSARSAVARRRCGGTCRSTPACSTTSRAPRTSRACTSSRRTYCRGERWYRSHFPSDVDACGRASGVGCRPGRDRRRRRTTCTTRSHPARAAQLVPGGRRRRAAARSRRTRASRTGRSAAQHTETLSFEDAVAAEAERCRGEEERIARGSVLRELRAPAPVVRRAELATSRCSSAGGRTIPRTSSSSGSARSSTPRPQAHLDELTARLGLPSRRPRWMRSRTTASMHPTCRRRRAPSSPSASGRRSTS